MTPCLLCEFRQKECAGACACTITGEDITVQFAKQHCPHPGGARFGNGVIANTEACSNCGSTMHAVEKCPIPINAPKFSGGSCCDPPPNSKPKFTRV